ncbi:MAG TPA: cytochrome c [Afifellaceae bacterium]|nr:cytochrome c [Afifellaceae bacterium]
MQTRKLRFGLTALVLAVMAAVYLSIAGPGRAGLLRPDDPRVTAKGALIYSENCAACHGAELEGEPDWRTPDKDGLMPAPPHDQSGHTWHHSEKLLFELTKFGIARTAGLKDYKTRMPAYEDLLSDDEILAVLSYIKSRWPEELQRRHTEMSAHDQ